MLMSMLFLEHYQLVCSFQHEIRTTFQSYFKRHRFFLLKLLLSAIIKVFGFLDIKNVVLVLKFG